MKRRFFMLLMMVLMVLGISQTAFADEVKYYEGRGMAYVQNEDLEVEDFLVEYASDYRLVTFKAGNDEYRLLFEKIDNVWYGEYDGVQYDMRLSSGEEPFNLGGSSDVFNTLKLSYAEPGGRERAFFDFCYLSFAEVSTDPISRHINSGFTGTAVSDRGDYDLFIAGYFSKELTDGTHVLTLSEIGSQTIAVIAHNNANEVNRNMNQSTIEEMTVNVSGGVMISMTIRGRVQTAGGTLDRYTTTITP